MKHQLRLTIWSTLCIAGGIIIGNSATINTTAHAGSTPPVSTTLNICVNNKTGAMRLPPNGRCVKGTEKLTPFAAGPAGPAGAPGSPGLTGAPGLTGPTGPTGTVSGLRSTTISYYTGTSNTTYGLLDKCSVDFPTDVVTRVWYDNLLKSYLTTTKKLRCETTTVYVP